MTTTQAPDADGIEQTLRATLTPRAALTAADRARRSSLLRRPGDRLIAGVCAAIAHAVGVPVRLVRLLGLLIGLLGIGVPGYLIAMLVLPRIRSVPGGAVLDTADAEEEVERPLDALTALRARPGDVLALLAVVPGLAGALLWIGIVLASSPAATAVLVALTMILLGLLLVGARRAIEARRGVLLAALARRADLVEPERLEAFLHEQHRRAPWAWSPHPADGALDALTGRDGSASGTSAADGAVRPRGGSTIRRGGAAPRRPSASGRTEVAVLAGMLAAGALTVLALNLAPDLFPSLAATGALPHLGRLAAGLALAAVVAGVALVATGLRGRRSLVLALAGCLALAGAGLGGGWLRLTHDPLATPVQFVAGDLEAGRHLSCPSGPGSWSRPVIIDLRELDAAGAERLRADQRSSGLDEEGPASSIGCHRPVGDLTVLLPTDSDLVRVWVSTVDGEVEGGAARGTAPVVDVWGDVLVGTVTIIEKPSTTEDGDDL